MSARPLRNASVCPSRCVGLSGRWLPRRSAAARSAAVRRMRPGAGREADDGVPGCPAAGGAGAGGCHGRDGRADRRVLPAHRWVPGRLGGLSAAVPAALGVVSAAGAGPGGCAVGALAGGLACGPLRRHRTGSVPPVCGRRVRAADHVDAFPSVACGLSFCGRVRVKGERLEAALPAGAVGDLVAPDRWPAAGVAGAARLGRAGCGQGCGGAAPGAGVGVSAWRCGSVAVSRRGAGRCARRPGRWPGRAG